MTDDVERGSAAEVVVMVATRSGNYRDVDLIWAAVFALLCLVVLVFSPLDVDPVGLIPNLALSFGLGFFLSRRLPAMRRLLTSVRRRKQQSRDAARVAFLGESLDATPDRVGVLIYLSLLERDLEIIADHGLEGRLGRAPQHDFRHAVRHAPDHTRLDVFLEAFERFGQVLAKAVPATETTVHGIPTRPRVVRE